jgi:subtilisin-like proprotein convertase family protein
MRCLLLILFGFFQFSLAAQVQVESGFTLEQYVNDVLLGTGVQASNITYSGGSEQLGMLTGAEDSFSIPTGLVMSSDAAENLGCPSDFVLCTGCLGSGFSDPDLLAVANSVPPLIGQSFSVSSVNDVSILEFDFTAAGDSIRFNYAFGSDEYETWINSQYNDVFAFFLSGPGITGTYASPPGFPNGAVNIAVVPNTDPALPITVSSVNSMLNSEYYINNQPQQGICINGYTASFTAEHAVQCGETYHIKLAIADGSDTALESVVVIEQGSFESNAMAQIDLGTDIGGPNTNTIYEDCGQASLTIERPLDSPLEQQQTMYISYDNGEALNGVDYGQLQLDGSLLPLPDSVVFEPFQSFLEIEFVAAIDGIDEGLELVELQIENPAACDGQGLASVLSFYIADNPPPLMVSGYEAEMCLGGVLELSPLVSGGYGNYTYDWLCNDEQDGAPFLFEPDSAGLWSCGIIVGDTCGITSQGAIIDVTVLGVDPLEVNIMDDSIGLGCNDVVNIQAIVVGGNNDPAQGGFYQYAWEDQDGNILFPSWDDPSVLSLSTWQNADEVFVSVTDACGMEASDSAVIVYNVLPLVIEVEDIVFAECESVISIQAEATGNGLLNYAWYSEAGALVDTDATLNAVIIDDATFVLVVQDECGESATVEVMVIANCAPPEEELCAYVDLGDGEPIPDDPTMCFSWETEVSIGDPSAIVSEVSGVSLFVNMEHSYMGDLTITYTCPNGQSLAVHQQGGGGTQIGIPDQLDGTGPGVGWDYSWSPTATNGTWADNAGGTLPAGIYESAQPFSLLEGCPVDGVWQIEICDLWGVDDGYLFAWGIDFGNCIEESGCTNPEACNYDPTAGFDDDSCTLPGCMDQGACNYDPLAGCDDQSCLPYDAAAGCMDQNACNFNPDVLCADQSCVYPLFGNDCNLGAIACGGLTVWDAANQMCVCEDGSNNANCPSDLNGNGLVEVTDLLIVLGDFGLECEE